MKRTLSYGERAKVCKNPTAKKIFQIMEHKKSNLSASLDVTTTDKLLTLADKLGPAICVLKTHIDVLTDFTPKTTQELTKLAAKHQFVIFEDRKFAEIGNTAALQYSQGIYHIADWSPLTNAHTVPGAGVIEGLKKVGLPKGNGLLLIAEMSSAGNLAHGTYTEASIQMAQEHSDFVIGFISRRRLTDEPHFLHMTPGVQFHAKTDGLGQQYLTPEEVIYHQGCDVIIVGRGIYAAANPLAEAKLYQKAGWEAYIKAL